MQMLLCPNCGKLTGFKRALGFGTFFMVLLTAGLWLLVIPFYPARCIACGLTRGSAFAHNFATWYRGLSPAAKVFVVFAPLVLLFGLGIFNALNNRSQPNPPTTFTANNALDSNAENDVPVSNTPSNDEDKVISIDAANLLSAYQRDEKTATAQFENRKVAVTGVLTGVFIPSIAVSMRVAESGGSADAFVTMGGPSPTSIEETLLLPGIEAYSETSSLFGQQSMNAVTDQLSVGETVTLVCTCKNALRVSDLAISRYSGKIDYSITLEDCTLQNNSRPESPNPGPAQIQSSQEAAAPGSTPAPENIMRAINAYDSSPQNRSKPYPVDADLEGDVRRALSTTTVLKNAAITAVSLHREVTLSGTVVDESSRELAEEIASQVPGVAAVHDNLTLAQTASQPANVAEGQTPEQVIAILGPPSSVTTGAKHIYNYPHLSVIFAHGKVSEIHEF
jgi:hypothetical protein